MNRLASLLLVLLVLLPRWLMGADTDGNRLTYLDEFADPFHPSQSFPKLITPQWVGEPGVDLVVTYGIDDMRGHTNYERYLRPILDRLKQIDGRAPVSIFSVAPSPDEPHLQTWLKEGLSLEVHTLSHPCPILGTGNFAAAQNTFHGCVDLLNHVPGNQPVAFRTPCCDSIDSASPRLFAELLARKNSAGQFLRMDSSVTMLFTPNDPELPAARLQDAAGRERFRKYAPFEAFTTTIENYPYPYVHTRYIWEMPFVAPSDWQSFHLQGEAHPQLLEDWKVALDFVAQKHGTFNFVFHPANWSNPTQHVAFIDYAVATYGRRVKFLNYRETHERLTRNLLAGQPLRADDGADNGVRVLDLNHDGYLDVVVGNEQLTQTRLWDPAGQRWVTSEFPARLVTPRAGPRGPSGSVDAGGRFGIVGDPAQPVLLLRNETEAGAWRFRNGRWEAEPELLRGLELEGRPVLTARAGQDLGVRLRDIDRDGTCEVLVANPQQNAVFRWEADRHAWTRLSYGLPPGAALVNERGEDNGVRFVDLNKDGYDDVLFSNEDAFSIHLMVPERILGFTPGWSREVMHGRRGQAPELPMFARSGPARNNGAWFTETSLYLQNEDTARLTNLVARSSFTELLNGFMPGPLNPADALATLQAPTNFVVELVAQEPLVQSPVYLNWGEDGRLWVVEMRDYPLGLDGHGKSGGAIRVLEDTDGDGRYDKSTVFAEGLNFPNGLLPWRKGLLVSAAPDLLYLEDTDGDGKADRIEKLYTGFVEGNQQHRFNGFEYGLDNWLYGANGDSSGRIRNLKTSGDGGAARGAEAVNISGRDFRFRPDDGAFETVGGHTQFGRRRDDWGNWFGNANPIWLWHFWLPEQYLRRNPRLAVENLQREIATYPEAGRVRFVGRKQQRLNDVGTAGYVTSANSPTPYRDEVFGEEFARAMFISEPVYNSVRCEILEPDGVSFKSHRWHAEEAREFLTSTDPWFRPTGLKIGPDGALYVPDMYRQYIEHPEWIPDDIKARADLRAGETRGRIYRVSWRGAPRRMAPRLDRMSTADLVAAIDHPNGWQRDTIQRLLVTRGGTAAILPLRQFLRTVTHPKALLTALHALEGLNGLQVEDLLGALQDSHPAIREHAIQLSEPWLRGIAKAASQPLQTALLARLDDPEMRVRYQLAFTLGEWEDPRVTAALARVALRDAGQREVLVAVASSATRDPAGILSALLAANQDLTGVEPLLRDLVTLIIAIGRPAEADKLFAQIARPVGGTGAHSAWQIAAFAQLLQELERQGQTLKGFPSAAAALPALRASARTIARDPDQPAPRRISVLQLLGRAGDGQDEDIVVLGSLLSVQMSEAVQRAAVDRIGRIRGDAVPATLVKGWSGYAPSVRALVLDVLLRREAWAQVLLDRIDAKELTAADLGAGARQRLLAHPSPALRQRAEKLLTRPVDTQRQKLIDQYLPAVQEARGDAAQGANVFQAQCAVCHRLNQQGNGAAPDLSSVVNRSPERMLIAILDPNRAVEDRYINYVARTRNGEDFSGILSGETANSITLISASGLRETILRRDLESLTSTRLSLMPEGFEQLLRPQDIADLLAYLDAAIGKR